jgi:hypothetical protein
VSVSRSDTKLAVSRLRAIGVPVEDATSWAQNPANAADVKRLLAAASTAMGPLLTREQVGYKRSQKTGIATPRTPFSQNPKARMELFGQAITKPGMLPDRLRHAAMGNIAAASANAPFIPGNEMRRDAPGANVPTTTGRGIRGAGKAGTNETLPKDFSSEQNAAVARENLMAVINAEIDASIAGGMGLSESNKRFYGAVTAIGSGQTLDPAMMKDPRVAAFAELHGIAGRVASGDVEGGRTALDEATRRIGQSVFKGKLGQKLKRETTTPRYPNAWPQGLLTGMILSTRGAIGYSGDVSKIGRASWRERV